MAALLYLKACPLLLPKCIKAATFQLLIPFSFFLSFFLEYRDDVNHSFTSQYPFQPKIVGDTLKSVKFGKRKEVKVEWRGERDRQEEKRNE